MQLQSIESSIGPGLGQFLRGFPGRITQEDIAASPQNAKGMPIKRGGAIEFHPPHGGCCFGWPFARRVAANFVQNSFRYMRTETRSYLR